MVCTKILNYSPLKHEAMKLGWFVPTWSRDYNKVPASVWIRCYQLIPYLKEMGYTSTINDFFHKPDIAIIVRREDYIIKQVARLLKRRGVKVVYDINVNYYERWGENIEKTVFKNQVKQAIEMTRMSDAVFAASKYIHKIASDHNENSYYLPDSVDLNHFCKTKTYSDEIKMPLKLIWSGINPKIEDLRIPINAIKGLPVEFYIISDNKREIGMPYKFIRWEYQSFPDAILQGDLCISPKPMGNSYDMGHSYFKIAVFLAQGVPVIASSLPSYEEIITNGKNGYIAKSIDDWRRYLSQIIENPELLKELSHNAIEGAPKVSTEIIIKDYDKIFNELVG